LENAAAGGQLAPCRLWTSLKGGFEELEHRIVADLMMTAIGGFLAELADDDAAGAPALPTCSPVILRMMRAKTPNSLAC
jgi:hypothetical protein